MAKRTPSGPPPRAPRAASTAPPLGPAERRIALTPMQLQQLGAADAALATAAAAANQAKATWDAVLALTLDAHGVTPGPGVSLDPRTGEIVIAPTPHRT